MLPALRLKVARDGVLVLPVLQSGKRIEDALADLHERWTDLLVAPVPERALGHGRPITASHLGFGEENRIALSEFQAIADLASLPVEPRTEAAE